MPRCQGRRYQIVLSLITRPRALLGTALSSQADNILVLQNGSILESGTHAELILKKEGAYGRLVRLQTEGMALSRSQSLVRPAAAAAVVGSGPR